MPDAEFDAGVGVALTEEAEERGFVAGGPMLPVLGLLLVVLIRLLRPRVVDGGREMEAAEPGRSAELLRSWALDAEMLSPALSEAADGGRTRGVAVNTEESLFWDLVPAAEIDLAGVAPPVPRTPNCRLIFRAT